MLHQNAVAALVGVFECSFSRTDDAVVLRRMIERIVLRATTIVLNAQSYGLRRIVRTWFYFLTLKINRDGLRNAHLASSILFRANSTYSGEQSIPIKRRPNNFAILPVVPLPHIGSSTRSPRLLQ